MTEAEGRLWSALRGKSLGCRVRTQHVILGWIVDFYIASAGIVIEVDGDVHDLLLQILGEGRLTDGTGRTVSFRNTVVMLTSNLGADTASRSMGFGGPSGLRDVSTHYLSAAAAFFRPELLNRFDHVVPYKPLSPETVQTIARRTPSSGPGGLALRGPRRVAVGLVGPAVVAADDRGQDLDVAAQLEVQLR